MTKKISLPPILIIDDDPLVLETLGDLCASMDCKRQVHRLDTKSAFDAAADPDIGLIVCDYRFPNASGIAFIEQVRRRGVETPVLFISGRLVHFEGRLSGQALYDRSLQKRLVGFAERTLLRRGIVFSCGVLPRVSVTL